MKEREEELSIERAYQLGRIRGYKAAEQNPSDALITRILNCIGYEDESWIAFVRKELERRKEEGL